MGETLQDILTRIEARLFEAPAGTSPDSPAPMDMPMVSPGHTQRPPQGTADLYPYFLRFGGAGRMIQYMVVSAVSC